MSLLPLESTDLEQVLDKALSGEPLENFDDAVEQDVDARIKDELLTNGE